MSEEFEKWWEEDCRYLGAEEKHKADFLFKGACQRAFTAGAKAVPSSPTYEQGYEEGLREMRERAANRVDELRRYLEQLAMEEKLAVADNSYSRAAYEAELCAAELRALPINGQGEEVCDDVR